MDRKEFLKTACGLGVCGCALNLFGMTAPLMAAETPAEDQRLKFVRYQVALKESRLSGARRCVFEVTLS